MNNMIEQEHRKAHWRDTRLNTLISIALLAGIILLCSLFVGLFSGSKFLGFPLSFYTAAQGGFLLLIALVFWSQSRQEAIDRKHGAAEEL